MLFNLRIHVGLGAKTKQKSEPQSRKAAKEMPERVQFLGDREDHNELYARIAEGNALAEAEEYARRLWGG